MHKTSFFRSKEKLEITILNLHWRGSIKI